MKVTIGLVSIDLMEAVSGLSLLKQMLVNVVEEDGSVVPDEVE